AGSIFLYKPPGSSILPELACWCSRRHAVHLFAGHVFAILLRVCEVPGWTHLADIPCRSSLPLGRPSQCTNQSAMTWVNGNNGSTTRIRSPSNANFKYVR